MVELTLLIPMAFLGALLWRADRRFDRAEEQWRAERMALITRVQAPERSVFEGFEPSSLDQFVPFDDDEAFQAEREQRLSG